MSDEIKTVEFYRGVGIHDCQPRERIDAAVKPAIDHVFAIEDAKSLYLYLDDFRNPPEARMLALAKLEAIFQISVTERRVRPGINMDRARALGCGLNSRRWRDWQHYVSLFGRLAPPISQWDCIRRDAASVEAVRRDQEDLRAEERK